VLVWKKLMYTMDCSHTSSPCSRRASYRAPGTDKGSSWSHELRCKYNQSQLGLLGLADHPYGEVVGERRRERLPFPPFSLRGWGFIYRITDQ
jgi:hypothetical protein